MSNDPGNYYRSIFISDTHLGFKASKAKRLFDFLRNNQSDYLYLVGDIIDIQRMIRKSSWKDSHTQVINELLYKSNNGTQVYYITGNHDDVFRKFLHSSLRLGNIEFYNQCIYVGLDGKRYIVIHGDLVDSYVKQKYNTLVKFILHKGYNVSININIVLDQICSMFRLPTFNYVEFIKKHVKQAMQCVDDYEIIISNYSRKHNFDGVICGHIHTPNIRNIEGITYLNCGDWVANCSAIVECHNGEWKLIRWK